MDEFDIVETLTDLALTAIIAVSDIPASEALNVPGEPRVIGETILNCLRMAIGPDYLPTMEEAIIAVEGAMEWDDLTIEEECHFINIHDIEQRWRLDFSFHFVMGNDPEEHDPQPYPVGISGLLLLDTSSSPEVFSEVIEKTLAGIRQTLISSYEMVYENMTDIRWQNVKSTMVH